MKTMARRFPFARPINVGMLLVSAGFALGLMFIVLGVGAARTGRDAQDLPTQIERISPSKGDSVLQQTPLLVDLIPGYTGELEVNGLAIPVEEVRAATNPEPGQTVAAAESLVTKFDPGSNTLTYVPQDGAIVERLPLGQNTIKVVYWRLDEGPTRALSYTWQFEVDA
jgi:hypothetical protein